MFGAFQTESQTSFSKAAANVLLVVVAVESEHADGGVSECGHDLWPAAGAVLGVVFGVGDIADPVQPVFDGPMSTQPAGYLDGLSSVTDKDVIA
jgi:hypothetical protein